MSEFDLNQYTLYMENGGSMESVREYVSPSPCRSFSRNLSQPELLKSANDVQLSNQGFSSVAKGSADSQFNKIQSWPDKMLHVIYFIQLLLYTFFVSKS